MSDNIEIRVKEILGRELSDIAPYIEVFDNGMVIDGRFTLEELKAIVQAWEEIKKAKAGK